MPSGERITQETRDAVKTDYNDCADKVTVIARRHGISTRAVYDIVTPNRHGTARAGKSNKASIYISKDDAELLLLLFLECDGLIPNKYKPNANELEYKLLRIADELTEI